MRKAQGGSRPEQYHFRLQRKYEFEVLGRELFKGFSVPIFNQAIGQYDQALLMTRLIDHDVSSPVAGEHILFGKHGKMQLHVRLHLRQIGVSGNITSFLRLDKVFVSIKGNNAGRGFFGACDGNRKALNFKSSTIRLSSTGAYQRYCQSGLFHSCDPS